jgi:hypothetical protein
MQEKKMKESKPLEIDEEQAQEDFEEISKFADKNQRLAWRRKMTKIDKLLAKLEPLNEQALAIILAKQPLLDDVEKVRQQMIKECVHPIDYLVHKGTHVLCKFCRKDIKPNR